MNELVKLNHTLGDFVASFAPKASNPENSVVLNTEQLVELLMLEAQVVGLHALVCNRYGNLPLELGPLTERCSRTGISITEVADARYKISYPPAWFFRMITLGAALEAIADALGIEVPPVKTKGSRSKYKALFTPMDEKVATGMTVKAAALELMGGDRTEARNFIRVWQRRNKDKREQPRFKGACVMSGGLGMSAVHNIWSANSQRSSDDDQRQDSEQGPS